MKGPWLRHAHHVRLKAREHEQGAVTQTSWSATARADNRQAPMGRLQIGAAMDCRDVKRLTFRRHEAIKQVCQLPA
jgi:hypothetical protein